MLTFSQHSAIEKIEKESLGKRRYKMPQITVENIDEFKQWMKDNDIDFSTEKANPTKYKATQCEFNKDKIESICNNSDVKGIIFVSSDDRVVDGHHRWIAEICKKTKEITTIKINLPIDEVLDRIKSFEKVESKKLNENWRYFFKDAFSS